eukprot:2114739-Rhodomonas_salina.1
MIPVEGQDIDSDRGSANGSGEQARTADNWRKREEGEAVPTEGERSAVWDCMRLREEPVDARIAFALGACARANACEHAHVRVSVCVCV